MTSDVALARLTADAIEDLARIEQSAGDVHWSKTHFEQELASSISRFFVLKQARNILGYGGYWKVADGAQITNLVIVPEARRRGLGRLLLDHLLKQAAAEGCRNATLEVRSLNQAALGLYQTAGFNIQSNRPRAYSDPCDDAILMVKTIG